MAQKMYEQYEIGEMFESYGRTITEADLVNYTCLAGLKLPMFIDEEFSRKHSIFGTRVAPGLLPHPSRPECLRTSWESTPWPRWDWIDSSSQHPSRPVTPACSHHR